MAEKMRVHILAKELKVPSKMIITKCKAEGLDVTNHMSTLSAGLEATIREWFSEGKHDTTVESADRVDLEIVRKEAKAAQRKADRVATKQVGAEDGATESATAIATVEAPPKDETGVATPEAETSESATVVIEGQVDAPAAASEQEVAAVAPEAVTDASETPAADAPVSEEPAAVSATEPQESEAAQDAGEAEAATKAEADTPAADATAVEEVNAEEPEKIRPAGPQNVPLPVKLKGPRVVRYEPVDQDVRRPPPRRAGPMPPPGGAPPSPDAPGRRRGRGRGAAATAAEAANARKSRGRGPLDTSAEKLKEWRNRDLAERKERISDATGRRIHNRRGVDQGRGGMAGPAPRKTKATVQEPIVMKGFCAATGISMIQILPLLKREFNVSGSINMELTAEMAEYIALEKGVVLTVMPAKTALNEVEEEFANREPKQLKPRAPVVTFLGHVDHGKTSLLDAIRETRVTDSEDGGITQHIGAYHLDHPTAGKVTFVDTPGHAAFTAMRARGAGITDIVVLLVAADDGLMPQTIEAINHAKAAKAPVVVALNKIDLGTQNVQRIYGQLAEHGLQPSGDWGGDTDVIHVSATKGTGLSELIEHLSALGEVLDLKADFKGKASGTVIEAETREGVGPVARVLVQDGLLKTGAMVVCGNAFGKVRALVDDRGKRLKEATPSIPVELWGLDEVPAAGDKFYVLDSMQRAKTVAEDCRRRRAQEGRRETHRVRTLEEAFKQRDLGEVPALSIIIKADVDGSLDALRGTLGKIPSEEVRLTFRHTAVGAVNDSDILLADASDSIIIAYRVAPMPGARKLAENKGVDLRQYKVIYDVADDIKKALEGLLSPDRKEENRAACQVREIFNITKVGTVAGCMVTSGTIQRSHLVRINRDGVIVRDGCKVDTLKRFKDDAKEVRSGMECGIRLVGFDDIKPGDILEAYEIVSTARTL